MTDQNIISGIEKYLFKLRNGENNIDEYYNKELRNISDRTKLAYLIAICKLFETDEQRNRKRGIKEEKLEPIKNVDVNKLTEQYINDFIKQNVNWRNKSRDFEIYKEIQKGTLYSEIAGRLECDISTISKINKKVQSSINNLKGKLFEIEYEKYLRSLNKFKNGKIVRDGKPGKPDIYIVDNIRKELYIFSLKNLELNKKSFCITKEQLKPELEFAYYKSNFEEYNKVILYLIVFDSLTEKLYIEEVDYKEPSNINIHR